MNVALTLLVLISVSLTIWAFPDEHVRFFRWDDAGVIVSQSSIWKEKPEDLLKFFLYLASCTMKEQSYNPTTQLVCAIRRVRRQIGGVAGGAQESRSQSTQ